MANPFKHQIKQYFNFIRNDRNGIIIISVLILLVFIVNYIIKDIDYKSEYDYASIKKEFDEWDRSRNIEESKPVPQSLFLFNPNIISESSLDSLDIPEFVKNNLIKYRNSGGKFKNPSQIRKIYGMNDSIYLAIEQYIKIPQSNIIANKVKDDSIENNYSQSESNKAQFENRQVVRKVLPILTPIDLNIADSLSLVMLQGIGPVFASRILKYRKLLGGYYSPVQLLEVYNFPEETYMAIKDNVFADTTEIKKIRVNFAEYKELLRHPYLNKSQVESILKQRELNGPFKNNLQLLAIPEIDSISYSMLQYYFSCN